MQYVDQEQATLTLHDVSIPFLEKNWDGLFKEIQAMNIKLIYIDILSSQDIDTILNIIKTRENVFIRTNSSCFGKKIHNHIIKCSFQDFQKNKQRRDVYYEIDYSLDLLRFLKNNKGFLKRIILSIPANVLSADEIFREFSFTKEEIMFNTPIISLNTIKEHPCNALLCSGTICHGGKGNLPRQLVINEKGDVSIQGFNEFILGNIYINNLASILTQYKNSSQHLKFIELNRKAFIRYVLSNIVKTLVWNNCVKSIK